MVEMEETDIHQGKNVQIGRDWKKLSQSALADLIGTDQSGVSKLEKNKKIEKPMLEKIAKALNIDVDFLETFNLAKHLKPYSVTNENPNTTITSNDQATENVGSVIENQTIDNSIPFSALQQYFDTIRKQDKEIADLRVLLAQNGIQYNPGNN